MLFIEITFAQPYTAVWLPGWEIGAWAKCSKNDEYDPRMGAAVATLKVFAEHLHYTGANDVTNNIDELPPKIDVTIEIDHDQWIHAARSVAEMVRNGTERALAHEHLAREMANELDF